MKKDASAAKLHGLVPGSGGAGAAPGSGADKKKTAPARVQLVTSSEDKDKDADGDARMGDLPVQKAQTQRFVASSGAANSQLIQEKEISRADTFTYQAPPGSSAKNTEIEETKDPRMTNSEASNNEELFKHLSYLSQLNNDVSKH